MTSNGDDYIGSESCNIDLQNDFVLRHCELSKINTAFGSKNGTKRKEKRELPPPIPQMEFVLRRYYTSDGRLILREEKVKHHECFQMHRANGRLTMHLVHLDHEAKEKEDETARTSLETTDPNDLHILPTPVGTTLFLTLHRKAKLSFRSKNTPKRYRTAEAGLKTLFHSEFKPPLRVVHRCTPEKAAESELSSPPPPPLSWMWSPSSPAFRMIMMGDVIGTESGDCMIAYVEELRAEPESPKVMIRCRERREKRKRQFPPPLTLMRETSEMSLTFKREYNGDGRLTVTAERVRRGHEQCIMEVRKVNERVTMWLVREDGVDEDDDVEMRFNEGLESEEEECGFEFEEEMGKEGERCGDLRECVSVTCDASWPGGLLRLHHSDSFPDLYLGRAASAPIRPMTPVM
ncbi:unnamed protein product [Sphenostylis stenocarpa]|uniref:FAF domain-containing protein n=1 Tax=Sphenostylis stenocarpa TaxID=92480 RepID=A0AA86T028_9FABA|nr:unnamed protein product [Sphenostylis stenocarpa]